MTWCTICPPLNFSNIIVILVGVTDQVEIDENGDRVPSFFIHNFLNGERKVVGKYEPSKNNTVQDIIESAKIYFPGHSEKPPLDVPVCGFDNENCEKGKSFK